MITFRPRVYPKYQRCACINSFVCWEMELSHHLVARPKVVFSFGLYALHVTVNGLASYTIQN